MQAPDESTLTVSLMDDEEPETPRIPQQQQQKKNSRIKNIFLESPGMKRHKASFRQQKGHKASFPNWKKALVRRGCQG